MGYISKLTCKCGFHRTLMLGTGRGIPDVEFVREQLPRDLLREFNEAYEKGCLSPLFYIENLLSYCPQCQQLKESKVLHYQINGLDKLVYDTCDTCGGIMQRTGEEIHCPTCGRPLKVEPEGYWD